MISKGLLTLTPEIGLKAGDIYGIKKFFFIKPLLKGTFQDQEKSQIGLSRKSEHRRNDARQLLHHSQRFFRSGKMRCNWVAPTSDIKALSV
jgi:hypothetical protein